MHDQYYLFVWNVIGMLSVRNSMAPISGSPWWCLIYIIW